MENILVKKLFNLDPDIFSHFFPENNVKSKYSRKMHISPGAVPQKLKPEFLLPKDYATGNF